MSGTKMLVSFIYNINYDHLPKEAIRRAKHCLLDGLGVMLAGYRHPATQVVLDYSRNLGGKPHATVIGSGFKTSLPLTALINGTMCHVMDFDDTNWEVRGHLTTVLLPTILAVGEKIGASGKELLLAYILGFETACKIGKAINPSHYERGYHSTSTIGIFGATTAAGKLLGLSSLELAYAYGIAGSRSAGLRANFGTMTKSLHAGLAAHDSITAVLLAKLGYTSNSQILETEWGFGQVMSPEANFETPFQNLGNPLDIISSGVVVKQYPSCARTHTALDAALGLIHENHIDPSEIVRIKCGTDAGCFKILIHPRPQNGLEAKFSMQYCLARACIDGQLDIDHFTDEKVRDPQVQTLMERVTHYIEPDIVQKGYQFRAAAKVTMELKSGRILEKTIYKAKGNPENPLSYKELVQKFRGCAKDIIDDDHIEKVIHFIDEMETISDIREVIRLLISNQKEL